MTDQYILWESKQIKHDEITIIRNIVLNITIGTYTFWCLKIYYIIMPFLRNNLNNLMHTILLFDGSFTLDLIEKWSVL